MIKEATISVIAVMIILFSAYSYYAIPTNRHRCRSVFGLVTFTMALIHVVGDGLLRAAQTDPVKVTYAGNGMPVFLYYIMFLIGLVGTLQGVIDLVHGIVHEKTGKAAWFLLHIPAVILTGLIVWQPEKIGVSALRYIALLYALVLLFMSAWYYEKCSRGLRAGLIAATIGSVALFFGNSILSITNLPLLTLVLLTVLAVSHDRDDAPSPVLANKPEESAMEGLEQEKPEQEESAQAESVSEESAQEDAVHNEAAPVEQEPEATKPGEPMQAKAEPKETVPEVQTPKPKPREPVPVKIDDSELKNLKKMEQTVAVSMREKPLILEKTLKEKYHELAKASEKKDQAACEEILKELNGYRIAGIHLTRFERIRHAIENSDFDSLNKEVEKF